MNRSEAKGVVRKRCSENNKKFTEEHLCRRMISIELPFNFIEITLQHGRSPVNPLNISGHLFIRTSFESCF